MDDQVLAELFRESDNVKSKTIIDENIKVSASSSDYLLINDKIETVSEANDLLKNGILIETREGVKLLSLTDALTSGVGGLNLSVEDFHHVATQLLSNQPITALLDIPPKPLESIAEVGDGIAPHSNSLTENDFGGNFPLNKTQKDIGSKFESKKTEIIPQSTVTLGGSASIGASPLAEAFKNAICDNEVEVGGNKKPLESIAEIGDNITYSSGAEDNCFGLHFLVNQSANDNQLKYEIGKTSGILPRNILTPDESVSESSSPLVGVSESANSDSSVQSCNDKVKRKGGWPKGRKRKPELYENRPPKAPSTGYVFYLNEKRKLHKNVPFSEVTKLLGNEWSKLSLEEKRAYLESAEVDKKRYREELRIYRKSEAYQSYLRRKRLKSLQANGTEESDVDATDELDEEDNEELYCRVCDQWFVTLHNKKEHLHGRQHFQNISQFEAHTQGGGRVSSLDESSLDGAPVSKSRKVCNETVTMSDAIAKVFQLQAERDKEITYLKKRLETQMNQKREYIKAMQRLKAEEERLSLELQIYKRDNQETEKRICNIWKVLCL